MYSQVPAGEGNDKKEEVKRTFDNMLKIKIIIIVYLLKIYKWIIQYAFDGT